MVSFIDIIFVLDYKNRSIIEHGDGDDNLQQANTNDVDGIIGKDQR